MKRNCLLLLVLAMLIACGESRDGSEKQLYEVVDSFSTGYFNYDLMKAERFSTDDSRKWLQFIASNILQDDVDLLRQQDLPATVTIDELNYTGDSTAVVGITAHDFLRLDSIGKSGVITSEATFRLNAQIINGKWKIRMEGPLRSERRSHD
jgi:hypothetical protein